MTSFSPARYILIDQPSLYGTQLTQMRILLSDEARTDHANIEIIREKLTRSLPAIFPEVIDELAVAVSDHVSTKGEGRAHFFLSGNIDTENLQNGPRCMQYQLCRTSSHASATVPLLDFRFVSTIRQALSL